MSQIFFMEMDRMDKKWTTIFRRGTNSFEKMKSENISGVNRSRHFGTGTSVASQLKRMLRQSMFEQFLCHIMRFQSVLPPLRGAPRANKGEVIHSFGHGPQKF